MVEVDCVGLLHCGPDSASTTIVSGCVRLDPTVASGYALHCLTTVPGVSSHYILRETVGFGMVDEAALTVYRPSPRHSITPRLTFVKRGACKPESQERSYTLLRNGIYSTTFSSQFAFGVSPDLLYGLTWRGCTACAPERDCPSCRFRRLHAVSHGLP